MVNTSLAQVKQIVRINRFQLRRSKITECSCSFVREAVKNVTEIDSLRLITMDEPDDSIFDF